MTGKLILLGLGLVLFSALLSYAIVGSGGSDASVVEPTPAPENAPAEQPPAPFPVPTAEVAPSPPPPNRLDCRAIAGTPYLSPDERSWFRDNCLSR